METSTSTSGSVETPTRGRPRDRRLDTAIAAATRQLLAERGYSGLTLAEVAERSGTTTPTIYRRFSSKADLVVHVVFRIDGDETIADTGDLESDVRMMIRWSLEKLGSPEGRAAFIGLLGEPSAVDGGRLRPLSLLWRRQAEHLAAAAARGEIRGDVDPNLFVAMLVGPVLLASSVLGVTAPDEEWVERLTHSVLDGLRPRPRPRTPKRTERP